MSQKKKISVEQRPTSASVEDQKMGVLPAEPLKYRPPRESMPESVDSLHMPFYTQYRTSVFLLKLHFMLNESQVNVSLSSKIVSGQSQPSLILGEYKDIQLAAVQRDLDNVLRSKSNGHIGSYYCEQKGSLFVPVFEVVFPNESCLKRFLENRNEIKEDLVKNKLEGQRQISTGLTIQLELYLAITAPKSARRVIPVNNENYHSCMQAYLNGCAFSISDLFQVETATPITSTDLDELISELDSIVDWFTLGLKFDVPGPELKKIETSQHSNVNRCKRDMLILRLRQTEPLTWLGVVGVLNEMNEKILAKEIAQKFGIVYTLPIDVTTDVMKKPVVPVRDEEKEKELKRHIKELREQIEQQEKLEHQAKYKEDQLKKSEEQIAKLEEEKKKLMEQQGKQLDLSTSLNQSNMELQKAIQEKDKELREARDKCTKIEKELKETKEKLDLKTSEVKKLESAVKSLEQSLEITKETSKITQDCDLKRNGDGNQESQMNFPSTVSSHDSKLEMPSVQPTIKFLSLPSSYTTTGTEEHVHFIVETQNMGGEKFNPSAQLKMLLRGPSSEPVEINIIEREEDSQLQYEAIYTSDKIGIHVLDVYISGDLASSQPITVYPNAKHTLLPFKSILFKNVAFSEFKAPMDIDVDSLGRLWIAQSECISVVDSANTLHPVFKHAGIVSVSIDEHDSVFIIADYNLIKIDSKGNISKKIEIKEKKSSKKNYLRPSKVRTHQDKVYVYLQDHLQVWIYSCNLDRRIDTIPLGGGDIDIEVDRNKLYVMRKENIQILTLNSEMKKTIQIPCNRLSNPQRFCVAGDNIYVIETHLKKSIVVNVLTMTGESVKCLKQRDGTEPYRVSVGRDGHIYVCCQQLEQTVFTGGGWEGKIIVY